MSEYTISSINYSDKRAIAGQDALLKKEGIERDKNLDYSVGLYDDDYNLVATGSCFKNTLRCMAVDSSHQGEGLMNQIVSYLIQYQYERGYMDLFLYTKCDKSRIFGDLGFYELARVEDRVVFMENKKSGFTDYINMITDETTKSGLSGTRQAAVVMNANPFTFGHQYLVETAATDCDVLHLFMVSEDASLIPFSVREKLIREGTSHLKNIVYHRTGSYMISSATFPSYFLKDHDTVIDSHAKLDVNIFIKIASALGITARFVGDEPTSHVTGMYNHIMKEELTKAGMQCHIIPRKQFGDSAISASTVRKMIHDGDIEGIKSLVPESTYNYFSSDEAKAVISAIRSSDDVIHY